MLNARGKLYFYFVLCEYAKYFKASMSNAWPDLDMHSAILMYSIYTFNHISRMHDKILI